MDMEEQKKKIKELFDEDVNYSDLADQMIDAFKTVDEHKKKRFTIEERYECLEMIAITYYITLTKTSPIPVEILLLGLMDSLDKDPLKRHINKTLLMEEAAKITSRVNNALKQK